MPDTKSIYLVHTYRVGDAKTSLRQYPVSLSVSNKKRCGTFEEEMNEHGASKRTIESEYGKKRNQ